MISKAIKSKDFTGQNIYVGIDIHHKSWMVSVYSDEFELKTFSQPPDADLLEKFLKTHYPQAVYHLAYEAGFCGFWIQRIFASKGINCQVIHPADVPSSDKDNKRKTDKVDSRKIAKGLKNGDLNAIYVPTEVQEADRLTIRARSKIVQDSTMVKNRIKAFLKVKGIAIPEIYSSGNWSKSFIAWLYTLPLAASGDQITLSVYVEELEFLINRQKKLEAGIKSLSETQRYATKMKLITSVPSIGLISAMTLLTEFGDITRFKKIDHLCSYCGLTPTTHNSGETERIGGLSRRGNLFIKTMLIECSWMAIRKDPALLLYYKQLLPRMNANKAIIKVARKLLNRIRYVLINQKQYVTGVAT